jgi:hypothetical protein
VTQPVTSPPPEPNDDSGTASPPATTPTDFDQQRLASENRKYRLQLKAQTDELEKLKQAAATETEQAVMKARTEGESAYKARWRDALVVNAALGRLASKGITATELAVKALELGDVDVDLDSGRVDSAALDARIDELLTRFPMLVGETTDSRPAPSSVNAGSQRRVTSDEILAADQSKRNDLLRMALRSGQ